MSTTATAIRPEVTHDLVTAELHGAITSQERLIASATSTINRIGANPAPYEVRQAADAEDTRAQAQTARTSLVATLKDHESGYTGWSRFFLVTSSQGHVHSHLNCSTCRPETTFAWLPTLSGLTEADAVAEQGEILCSVCFPTAPVAWTAGVAKTVLAERAAKDTAKAERAAKAASKALLPDGSPLRVTNTSIKTVAAAKTWLTDAFSWNRVCQARNGEDHRSYPAADVETVAAALAAKTGDTAEAVKAAADQRARKRDGVS